MPEYRRLYVPGGTFFFTLVTDGRAPLFADPAARENLRRAIARVRHDRPFDLVAIILLLDHLHLILTLPDGDPDFSTRLAAIKALFTRAHLNAGGAERPVSVSRQSSGLRGVWQKRFWEHLIRDDDAFRNHLDYVHFNPVKHGLATCPHAWQHSSFARWAGEGWYPPDWMCACDGRVAKPPATDDVVSAEWE